VVDEPAFSTWRHSLRQLTDSPESARAWREDRYRFAHRLGDALVGETATAPAISGPAVYGVRLSWGLLYIGQTTEAQRRLRDLAIGESHHLANTFPPEIWQRVVIVAWPSLPQAKDATARLGVNTVGLALEHRLQIWTQPLANASRRTSLGGWRPVDRMSSASVGAQAAAKIDALFQAVKQLWTEANDSGGAASLSSAARCVYPDQLL
jgi:hypothetical protein